MFEPNKPLKHFEKKHEFMYKEVPQVSPQILNDLIDKKLAHIKVDNRHYKRHTVFCIEGVDVTKSKLAFGRPSVRTLWRQLQDPNIVKMCQALERMNAVLHDPERCFEAIRMDTVSRVLLLCDNEEDFVRERSAMILERLVQMDQGRESFLNNPKALDVLKLLLIEFNCLVRLKATEILNLLLLNFFAAKVLIENDFLKLVIDNIIEEGEVRIVLLLLDNLKAFLETDAKEEAINLGALPVLIEMLLDGPKQTEIVTRTEACLALLMVHAKGKQIAIDENLMPVIISKLFDEDSDVQAKAAACVMNITHTTPSKQQAFRMGLHIRILELAHAFRKQELQINCIKALTNIAEVPEGRIALLEKEDIIQNIPIAKDSSESVRRHLETLLTVLHFKP